MPDKPKADDDAKREAPTRPPADAADNVSNEGVSSGDAKKAREADAEAGETREETKVTDTMFGDPDDPASVARAQAQATEAEEAAVKGEHMPRNVAPQHQAFEAPDESAESDEE